MIVLGGDVLIKSGNKYEHNYDSWYYNPDKNLSKKDNSSLSISKTIDYLNAYPASSKNYFILVLQ